MEELSRDPFHLLQKVVILYSHRSAKDKTSPLISVLSWIFTRVVVVFSKGKKKKKKKGNKLPSFPVTSQSDYSYFACRDKRRWSVPRFVRNVRNVFTWS